MPRVAMVVSNRYDPDPRVQKEAASLVAAGYDVDVYAFDREQVMPVRAETLEGVRVHRLQLGHFRYGEIAPTILGMSRFVKEVKKHLLANPPDVVHCHDQDTCPIGGWWQSRGARQAGKDRAGRGLFVYDAHDFYWTFLLMGGRNAAWRRAGALYLRRRERQYARLADLLFTVTEGIAQSPGTAELYRAWGLSPIVLWNASRPVREVQPLPPVFTVGYFGSVRELAMFQWLLAAIALLPPAQRPALRVAGGGTAQQQVQTLLSEAATRLGISVEITGHFEMSAMSTLMAQCSLQFCVYPRDSGNIDRSLPVKLLDAVAHGRPVIGNADTLMADWITKNHWGWLVREGDVNGLRDALIAARKALVDGALPPMAAPPTWDEQAEKLCAAYSALLAGAKLDAKLDLARRAVFHTDQAEP